MFRLTYRQLEQDLARTALTAFALAAVVAVILLLEGFYEGFVAQSRQLVLDRQADLIATQAGVANMYGARSVLPQFSRAEIEAVPGVAAAHPLSAIMVIYEHPERSTPVYLFVYDTAGGPRRFVAGGPAVEPRDIVIDRSLADRYSLGPGDAFVLSDFEFRIAGITADAAAVMTPFGFILFDGLLDFYFESDLAADISTFPLLSYLLIELEPGADRGETAERIAARVSSADVFLPEALADNDASLVRGIFAPVFDLLIGIGFLIGALVTAIVMFAAVLGRRRAFGVLKALGFSAGFLSGAVMLEAAVLALLAIPIGLGLAAVVAAMVEAAMPLYRVLPLEPVPLIRTAAATLAFAVAGALAPIPPIRQMDPALAFRS